MCCSQQTQKHSKSPLSHCLLYDQQIKNVSIFLMKRGHKGVYHHFSKKHLYRYLDEFSFRLNKGNCEIDTMNRIRSLVQNSENKRLTYEKLTE